MPLLLSHGWPGSVWEFHKILPLLTDPASYGGDPADAFTVVAPSLPGYTLSFKPGQPRFGIPEIAEVFSELMRDVLGYERFAAQGGDWGSFISAYLGLQPAGADNRHPHQPDPAAPRARRPPRPTTQRSLATAKSSTTGYARRPATQLIQGTKPQTLAYGLTDSPVGLAAWIVEKFRTWSDCDGDVETQLLEGRSAHQHHALLGQRRHRQLVLAVLRAPARRLAAARRPARRGPDRLPVVPEETSCTRRAAGRARLQHPALDRCRRAADTSRRSRSPSASPRTCAPSSAHYASARRHAASRHCSAAGRALSRLDLATAQLAKVSLPTRGQPLVHRSA